MERTSLSFPSVVCQLQNRNTMLSVVAGMPGAILKVSEGHMWVTAGLFVMHVWNRDSWIVYQSPPFFIWFIVFLSCHSRNCYIPAPGGLSISLKMTPPQVLLIRFQLALREKELTRFPVQMWWRNWKHQSPQELLGLDRIYLVQLLVSLQSSLKLPQPLPKSFVICLGAKYNHSSMHTFFVCVPHIVCGKHLGNLSSATVWRQFCLKEKEKKHQ